jgi:predicted permease
VLSRLELQDETVRIMGEAVSQTLLPMLGVEPAIGRSFLPEEDETPGAHPVVMLGYGFWQRAFAGDPEIVGTTIRFAGQGFTVVGVTSAGFNGLTGAGFSADFFVPLTMFGTVSGESDLSHFEDRLNRRHYVVGRVAEGVTPEGVLAGLEVLASRIQKDNPDIDQEWIFTTLPLEDVALDPELDGAAKPFAVLFMAAGGLVLLLACTNLSSFLLTRGSEREKEIALRLAIGAQRGALVRQLLTETTIVAFLGGASGVVATGWLLRLLTRYQPPLPVPVTLDVGLDMTVLLFTIGISCLAGLLFGLAPALRSTRPDIAPTLKEGMVPTRHRRFGLQNGLVAFQMALSVVLLIGGGLFVRSLAAARNADLGFSTRNAGIVWVDLALSGVPAPEQLAVRDELTRRARALPGIDTATSASHIPFLFHASGGFFSIPGADPPAQGIGHNVQREEVDPEFFATMGIPVLEGRSFTNDDRPNTRAVAIVNETAAKRFWPGESPVGRQFSPQGSERAVHIVGVAKDTKVERLREPATPLFYFPIAQSPDPDVVLVARGPTAPEEITGMLRKMVRDVSPSLMIMDAKTMEENVDMILLPGRIAAFLLGGFGLLALTLASIGLYGVVSFSVARRTREMGIRMSLGADVRALITMILRSAMALVGIGGAVGLATAFLLGQLVRHVLYGVGPWDLATILAAPFVLGCVAAAAALIPALRAGRVDPVEALKCE